MALARLTLLKDNLLLNEPTDGFDDSLKAALEVATAQAETFTNRTLEKTVYTDEFYTGDGEKVLYLLQWPVTALTDVKIWDGTDSFDSETSTYYELINERYIYYPKLGQDANATYGAWPSGTLNNLKITYTAGYDTAGWDTKAITVAFPIPEDLEYAVAKMAALLWLEGKQSEARLGVQSLSRGAESVTIERFVKGIPPEVKDVLMHYRRLTL